MKTKLIALLTMCIFLLTSSFAMAAAAPAIFVNANSLATENPAIVEDGNTLVPLRAVFEALNQQVAWNASDKSITSGGIWLQINNPVATVNGENVNLEVPAKIINNVTYVPLQFIAASLDKNAVYNSEQNRIDITDKPVVEDIDASEDAAVEEYIDMDENAAIDEEATAEEEVDADENANDDEDVNAGENAGVDENTNDDEDVATDEDAGVDENTGDDEDVNAGENAGADENTSDDEDVTTEEDAGADEVVEE